MTTPIKVALIGNPNVGKTSVFNALTGLNQKVGNYPGITVDKKTGICKIDDETKAEIIDLPGTYSINPTSLDEEVALKLLVETNHSDKPDVVVLVAEVENLKRNLLLFSQVKDLGFPTILAINMADRMTANGITIDVEALEKKFDTKIVLISAKGNTGTNDLKQAIKNYKSLATNSVFDITSIATEEHKITDYSHWLLQTIENDKKEVPDSKIKKLQHLETVKRYQIINEFLKNNYKKDSSTATGLRYKLDAILTHKVWGYVIFFGIMLLVFQSIFEWSSIPMDFIDETFATFNDWLKNTLPAGKLTDLITDGLIAGINGVVIFIPQIAILFLFISILEESGYMSRVVFLMDRIMRPFGLNGKSIVPLISGTACAIPAIMSARNIENNKERLITMLITPFTTCSARIPVYVIIISLVIPDTKAFGFLTWQSLVMTAMYLLGFLAAILSGWILSKFIKSDRKSYFISEMPEYRAPIFKNVAYNVWDKTKAFVFGAGKIILPLSVLLWFLGTHGTTSFDNAEQIITTQYASQNLSEDIMADKIAAFQLENSYMGHIGKVIEPIVTPLGYDWKIGIAVLTSFSAREVFVGTLATIYNIGSHAKDEDFTLILDVMRNEVRADGTPVFTLATGVSILLFYAFAMQCISTIAITRKETNSLKWTIYQAVGMTVFAYIVSFLAYQILK
nr:ferrous iron transport protein B [uncultured Flavobacterium sp.]